MHGRLKVRTTEEQKILKQKEQQKKLSAYQAGFNQIISTRRKDCYEPASLLLSAQLLSLNPDIYTLWNFRKEAISLEIQKSKQDDVDGEDNLIKFLENEIKLTEQCLVANPKSYSAWHHRYWVLINHPKPKWDEEFNLCTKYLKYDDRNFHAWDFRRLLVNKIGISLSDELKFSTDKLNDNFSNFSSWHYRSTLTKLDEDSVSEELDLVQNAIFTDPMDSSAWFYLRWVLSTSALTKDRKTELLSSLEQLEELEPDCKWIVLAKCWLTGSLVLNDKNHVDRRVQFYKRLLELDPLRKGQYQDYLKTAEDIMKYRDDK